MTDSEDSTRTQAGKIRTLKKKGMDYRVQLLKNQSASEQRAWRRQINKLSNLLADSMNVDALKSERAVLENKMEILNAANERLFDSLQVWDNYEERKAARMKFESFEREHSETLRKVNDKILEIRQENESQRSRNSKRSGRFSNGRKSGEASIASAFTRKTSMAANVARLKTELQFADAEARKTTALKEYEDELRRFKLTKELALAKAEMEAIIKTEESESEEFISKEILPEEIDKNYVLENYLNTQASAVTNASNPTVVANVSIDEPLVEDPNKKEIPPIKDEPVNIPSKSSLVHETTSTSDRMPVIKTPKSLNPFAPDFEARPCHPNDGKLYEHQQLRPESPLQVNY